MLQPVISIYPEPAPVPPLHACACLTHPPALPTPCSTHPAALPTTLLQVVRELIALGIIVPTSDLLSIRRSIAFFVSQINRQAEQQEAVAVRQPAGWLPAPGREGAAPCSWVVVIGKANSSDRLS